MLKGLTLEAGDVGAMQDLCGFGFVIDGDKRFCDIFTGASRHVSFHIFLVHLFREPFD